jgi:hypothetical protein
LDPLSPDPFPGPLPLDPGPFFPHAAQRTSQARAIYYDFAWLRSFLLLFAMLLHAMPALVLAAICNDLYLNCRCDFQCFCIPALVVVAICNALPRLRYLLLLFPMCLHTHVSFVLLFTMILHGCVHFYGYLHVVVCISVLVLLLCTMMLHGCAHVCYYLQCCCTPYPR